VKESVPVAAVDSNVKSEGPASRIVDVLTSNEDKDVVKLMDLLKKLM
jgi:hypothetical protein